MNMRSRSLALSLCAITLTLPVRAADEKLPSGEALMEKSLEAAGGKAVFAKLHTTVLSGTMEMPAMNLKGTLKNYRAEPDLSLTEIELPGIGKMTEGHDGQVAWAYNAMQGPSLKQGEEKLQAVRGARFHTEDWKADYKAVRTLGLETFDGRECYKVELAPHQGEPFVQYLDRKTGLPAGMTMTAKTAMGDIKAETVISDYRKVEGTLVPHKITQKAAGQVVVITFETITYNVAIPKETFALPAEIQKLVQKK